MSAKDLEGVNINQDIQTFEERPSTSALKSSEVPSPVIISHETKKTDPRSGNENGTIENNIVIDDDQTEVIDIIFYVFCPSDFIWC